MKKKDKNILIIVLLILLLLFVYTLTLGLYNPFSNKESSTKNNLDSLNSRYRKLVPHIEKQKALKKRLDTIFKWVYFSFRIMMVIIYLLTNYLAYKYLGFNDLNKLLNLNEAVAILLAILFFIIYGDLRNLSVSIDQMKNYIKYRVYKKHVNLNEKIEHREKEKNHLEIEINKHTIDSIL